MAEQRKAEELEARLRELEEEALNAGMYLGNESTVE